MVSFKMFAGTDVGLRENNEDNFTVCPDITGSEWIIPSDHRKAINLGEKGCIMAVADGMGGQNAGEVASALAIETVQEMFSPANIPGDVLNKPENIKNYLKKVIGEADARVKEHALKHDNESGMGSTIIIAWLTATTVYIAWLGDSRAYSFVPGKGIRRLSKDHSYVQQLIDADRLTEEGALTHPDSNIITRSLGDTSQKAKADVAEHHVEDGEIILLCSDGLCGVCTDAEISGVIDENADDLQLCKEKLTSTALNLGGTDNITIALMQIHTDKKAATANVSGAAGKGKMRKMLTPVNIIVTLVGICLVGGLGFAGYYLLADGKDDNTATLKKEVKKGMRFRLDSNTIRQGERVKFHVEITGTGNKACRFEYPYSLLSLDLNDSTVSIKPGVTLLTDTTVSIKAVSNAVPELKGKAELRLKTNTDSGANGVKPANADSIKSGNPTAERKKYSSDISKSDTSKNNVTGSPGVGQSAVTESHQNNNN